MSRTHHLVARGETSDQKLYLSTYVRLLLPSLIVATVHVHRRRTRGVTTCSVARSFAAALSITIAAHHYTSLKTGVVYSTPPTPREGQLLSELKFKSWSSYALPVATVHHLTTHTIVTSSDSSTNFNSYSDVRQMEKIVATRVHLKSPR
jgi:hypothetical protein